MDRKFTLEDIGVVFTNCLFPQFVRAATESLDHFYPGLERIIVDDACREQEEELRALEEDFQIPVLRNNERVGTGRCLDRGLRELHTPLLLTVDHGIRLHKGGLLEILLNIMRDPEILCACRHRNDKKCNRAFGPYVDPLFALFDREFIVENDLSFKLTHIKIGDWTVEGCSTAQFLQYRAIRLGKKLGFMRPGPFYEYVHHQRTPHTQGRTSSPHEAIEIDEDYLPPRRRNAKGGLIFEGEGKRRSQR